VWQIYTTPYAEGTPWHIGARDKIEAKDRIKSGDYIYLTDCFIKDENSTPIYPLFRAR
jgi:hypothetical protein